MLQTLSDSDISLKMLILSYLIASIPVRAKIIKKYFVHNSNERDGDNNVVPSPNIQMKQYRRVVPPINSAH